MKKNKPSRHCKGPKETGDNVKEGSDNSVVVSDSLNTSQTATGSSGRFDETKMGETTVGRTNENNITCPEKEVTSSELRKTCDGVFGAGREVGELVKGSPVDLHTSSGSSDGQMAGTTTPSAGPSSVVRTNVAPSSTLSATNKFNVLVDTEIAGEINSNSNSKHKSKSHVPELPSTSIPTRSDNQVLELSSPSVKTESDMTELMENSEVENKNVSVFTVLRETKDSTKTFGSSSLHNLHLSKSNKSREIKQQGEMVSSSSTDYPPMSINVREVITTDIPQSLSTDSGIGSPLDVRTGIDPSPGQDTKSGKDAKWEVGNSFQSSLAPGVVVPNFKGRSGNYPPCDCPDDISAQPSSGDTSNYPTSNVPTSGESFRPNAFPKQESHSGDSLKSSEERNLDLQQTIFPYEKDPTAQPLATPLHGIAQNSPKSEDASVNFTSKHSIDSNNHSVGAITNVGTIDSEDLANRKAKGSSRERINSTVCTFQTSEFTVESESGHSNCGQRNETVVLSRVEDSESGLAASDGTEISKNWQLLGKLAHLSKSTDGVRKNSSESRKEEISGDGSPGVLPPGRKVKGILKTTSAPILGESREKALADLKNGQDKSEAVASRSVSFNQTHIKNTFSYNNVAFEGEIITEPSKRASLVEVVNQIMRHSAVVELEDDNSHPYGRDNSLTDLMTGKHRGHYKMDAGKMIVWLALAIMIVSLAGGIIFMSETYNMSHRDQDVVIPRYDTTTHEQHN